MNRRQLLGTLGAASAVAIIGLPGCAAGPTSVRVLVAARANEGETVASMRSRVFGEVSIGHVANQGSKVGWITWSDDIGDGITVINDDHTLTADEMITTEGDVASDEVNDATELPEEWALNEGDSIAFFALDCDTVAVAEGGEKLVDLAGDNDVSQIVVLRAGRVVEGVDFGNDAAEPGDELVIFGGKIIV